MRIQAIAARDTGRDADTLRRMTKVIGAIEIGEAGYTGKADGIGRHLAADGARLVVAIHFKEASLSCYTIFFAIASKRSTHRDWKS
jgi:hypothetical protein